MRPLECLPLFIGLLFLGEFYSNEAIAQTNGAKPEKITHKRGKETRDESKIINVTEYSSTIKPDGFVTILGQVFPPEDLTQDRETALKTAEEGLEALKKIGQDRNLDELNRTIRKMQIENAEAAIHGLKPMIKPDYDIVRAIVVEGKNRPTSAQYSPLIYAAFNIVDLEPKKSGIRTYQMKFKMPSQPGFYTVILTPIDGTSLPGESIVGASDTITVEVVEPIRTFPAK